MYIMQYPPDPDCPKCLGSGGISNMTGIGSFILYCDCRKPENLIKLRERCDHAYVCHKCGHIPEVALLTE